MSTQVPIDATSGEASAHAPPPPVLPLTSFVFAPKLPDADKLDADKLDALSSEELERVLMMEKKSTHTAVAPQVSRFKMFWKIFIHQRMVETIMNLKKTVQTRNGGQSPT